MHESPIVVAIVNSNPDIVRLLRVHLEGAGFIVIAIEGEDIKSARAKASPGSRVSGPSSFLP